MKLYVFLALAIACGLIALVFLVAAVQILGDPDMPTEPAKRIPYVFGIFLVPADCTAATKFYNMSILSVRKALCQIVQPRGAGQSPIPIGVTRLVVIRTVVGGIGPTPNRRHLPKMSAKADRRRTNDH